MGLHLLRLLDLAVASDNFKVCNPLLVLKSKICFKTIKLLWFSYLLCLLSIKSKLILLSLPCRVRFLRRFLSLFDTVLIFIPVLYLSDFLFQYLWSPPSALFSPGQARGLLAGQMPPNAVFRTTGTSPYLLPFHLIFWWACALCFLLWYQTLFSSAPPLVDPLPIHYLFKFSPSILLSLQCLFWLPHPPQQFLLLATIFLILLWIFVSDIASLVLSCCF